MNPTTATLGVALLAFAATPVGLFITGRQRRQDKIQDWARQDEVQRRDDRAAAATRAQLAKIQTTGEETRHFVDGAYTGQLSVELSVQRALAAMTQHTLGLIRAAGDDPPREVLDLLASTEARVKALVPLIAERTAHMDSLAEAAPAKVNTAG